MRIYMEANEPQGRKLEFMLQEVGRRVNTIGSKGYEYGNTVNSGGIKG